MHVYIRGFFLFIAVLLLFCSALAGAGLPEDVVREYRAYQSALKKKDNRLALRHAEKAWKLAEDKLGDSETTGNLAFNYANMAIAGKNFPSAISALKRSVELAGLAKENGPLIKLEREVYLASLYLATGRKSDADKLVKNGLVAAKQSGIDDSVFAGELMVIKARLLARTANNRAKRPSSVRGGSRLGRSPSHAKMIQKTSAGYARHAIEIFDKHPQQAQKSFKATAYKLVGFSLERDKKWMDAALAYQKAMEIYASYLPRESRDRITTIGRWANVRTHILADMSEEEAIAKGLCECWPFDREKGKDKIKRIAKPVLRKPPRMPSRATTSGFSFVKFDLDDDGNTINIRIIHSWPEKMYEKSSLAAVKKWKYTPKQDGETPQMRKDFVTTIRYILTDYWGGDTI